MAGGAPPACQHRDETPGWTQAERRGAGTRNCLLGQSLIPVSGLRGRTEPRFPRGLPPSTLPVPGEGARVSEGHTYVSAPRAVTAVQRGPAPWARDMHIGSTATGRAHVATREGHSAPAPSTGCRPCHLVPPRCGLAWSLCHSLAVPHEGSERGRRPQSHTFPRGRLRLLSGKSHTPRPWPCWTPAPLRGRLDPCVQPPSSDGAAGHSRPRRLPSPARASGVSVQSCPGGPGCRCCSPWGSLRVGVYDPESTQHSGNAELLWAAAGGLGHGAHRPSAFLFLPPARPLPGNAGPPATLGTPVPSGAAWAPGGACWPETALLGGKGGPRRLPGGRQGAGVLPGGLADRATCSPVLTRVPRCACTCVRAWA